MKVRHVLTGQVYEVCGDGRGYYYATTPECNMLALNKRDCEEVPDDRWEDVTEECVEMASSYDPKSNFLRHGEHILASVPDDYRLRKVRVKLASSLYEGPQEWAFIIERKVTE